MSTAAGWGAAVLRITGALQGRGLRGQGASWQCPAHDDRKSSLTVTGAGDRVLLHCFAGCSAEDIVKSLGLTLADLFDEPRKVKEPVQRVGPGKSPEATFDYTDEQGELLYQVVRLPGKKFCQRRSVGGGWEWGLNGTRRLLYRLPELLASDQARQVFVVEGEGDVETLRSAKLVATTNSGGADGWRSDLAAPLIGRSVVVLPDNDEPGRKRGARVAADALAAGAKAVRVVELPGLGEHGDVTDWLAASNTVAELKKLVRATPPSAPIPATNGVGHKPDLGVWLNDVAAEPIDWLWPGYIALGMLTVVDGDPGLGKSTMALDLAARVSTGRTMPDGSPGGQGGVVILSAEDHLAKVIRPRLDAVDADLTRILALEVVPEGDDDGERDVEIPADLQYIEQAIVKAAAVLVIVDPLVAFLGADVNSHRDQDIRRVLRRLKALAERLGVAIVVIRHLNKAAGGNPLYRGGGSIGIIGAARGGLLVAPDPDVEGRVVMACTKSNLGQMPSSLAFYIEGASNGAGTVRWDGASAHTSATLLAAPQDDDERSARQEAVEFLQDALARGPRPAKEVMREAEGFSTRTLERARKDLAVRAFRQGVPGRQGGGQSVWELPGSNVYSATPPIQETLADKTNSEYKSTDGGPDVGGVNMANQGELMVVDL